MEKFINKDIIRYCELISLIRLEEESLRIKYEVYDGYLDFEYRFIDEICWIESLQEEFLRLHKSLAE